MALLLRLRNALVPLVGIKREQKSIFTPRTVTANQALIAVDSSHVDFRTAVVVDPDRVTVLTQVRIRNRRGRAYMALVWPIHPWVVRAMLNRAVRSLTPV